MYPETKNGSYTAEVTLSGGSGRASVSSPAAIEITDEKITAEIVWSSPNYDYMEVDGTAYYPVNTEGNSVFVISVPAFDSDIPVLAETVAMSEPHMIEYTIMFDSSTLKTADSPSGSAVYLSVGAVLAVITASAVLNVKRKRKGK